MFFVLHGKRWGYIFQPFNSNLPELNSILFVLNDIIESTPVVKDRLIDYSDHKVCRFKVWLVGLKAVPQLFDGLASEARQLGVQHHLNLKDQN